MTADELFKSGRLQEAIDSQIQEVKSNPGDQSRRLFLFELLCFTGDLERARRQIEAIRYDDPGLETALLAYRKLLEIEEQRRRLLKGGPAPKFLSDPPEHARLRLDALNQLSQNQTAAAGELLQKAEAAAPTVAGRLNGKPFATLRDADDLFGSVLEVVGQGTYYWVPFEDIEELEMKPPRFPRDLLWFPARLQVRSGPAGDVYLPALYPNSHEHADLQVKLGRATDWNESAGGPVLGAGQRTFFVDEDEVGLLDWRELQVS